MVGYRERAIDGLLGELLDQLPALLIVGPRASGKTTTASRHAATIVSLDRAAEAAAYRADPDAALRGLEEPVLLDEWQAVPEVLGAVKRAVDAEVKADAAPGSDAARHLSWLRDQLGSRSTAGAVLHTGPRAYALADRIVAAPICTLLA
jgi:hypothetical protein